ncbi:MULTISPECIES: SDR family NAD(P)-dependent oxidoreductase [Variovorax]|jgi:3-oxoacyl-[acyl-carrier protein] reductase|uniref:SDR family NAD(P)-dependent oxidoreductase n=1 Tax=Variovorax TaxID=34072 RepID=UPI000F7DC19E|nr:MULTISPECIES: SDR family NAD(P)-dependent oxidoreductase [Variovorax]MBB3642168.1 3-oxoacyl-[acyl-carrier protein] reductase [Variovorax sp. BK613]MDR6522374.1 3-oxoacyl-[acyl-carrier protein] reductase [Variovorax paradoxus]RTD86624.1 SDR family oxidoreductase [Variovorax sp. 369]
MKLGLESQVALVTGGGQGVGRQICIELAREGARVVVNDLFPERAQAVAREIEAQGGKALAAPADITQADQVQAMIEAATRHFDAPVQILVNNAGIIPERREKGGRTPAFVDMPVADWAKIVNLNVYGTFHCCHAVLPGMVAAKRGRIVNIISEAGRIGEANMAVYSGAKAAIAGFAKALAREHGRHAITVNSIALGAVSHEGIKDGPLHPDATVQNNELLAKMVNLYPISKGVGRLSRPDDVSGLVAFLASDRALFVTGQTIGASGGFAMI